MSIALISFTLDGELLNEQLEIKLAAAGYEVQGYHLSKRKAKRLIPVEDSLKGWTQEQFKERIAIIFIGATGIAVRAIAPFLKGKAVDPAVIVLDDQGEHVIALLSGHLGGANALTKEIASYLDAKPVISTATDKKGILAIDEWAKAQHLHIAEVHHIKAISSALLRSEKVGLKAHFQIQGEVPDCFEIEQKMEVGVMIGLEKESQPFASTLHLIPQVITLGIGCRKGISLEKIEALVLPVLKEQDIAMEAVEKVTSIDLKCEEAGLLAFCKKYGKPFVTYSSTELQSVKGNFTASAFVKQVTQVENVCERAAVYGSGGVLIRQKTALNGVTLAIAQRGYEINFENRGAE